MGRKKSKKSAGKSAVLSRSSALPEAFLDRMKGMLGEEEYRRFLDSYQKPRHQALRVNTLKCSVPEFVRLAQDVFTTRPVPWCPVGFYYGESDRPGRHPWHETGMYYIQEPSAMAVAALSGTQPGERVLDLCAAPGGKSTQLAAMLQGQGLLVSNEINPGRAKILSQNIERMGIRNAVVLNEAPEALLSRFPSFFDRVVVDAPCSGEGMFRKEEAAIPNWSPENVQRCAVRQAQILDCAAGMLMDGGTLVYSTCTFSIEEDEGTVAAFCARHPEFSIVDLPGELGEKRMAEYGFERGFSADYAQAAGGTPETDRAIRLWPHKLNGEGHFVAVLKRDGKRFPHVRSEKTVSADDKALRLWNAFAKDALTAARPLVLQGVPVLFGQNLYLLPEFMDLKGLKVLRPGLMLGEIKKDRFEPAHSLAMALHPEKARRVLNLTAEDPRAAAFLRGESIAAAANTDTSKAAGTDESETGRPAKSQDGWTLVTVDGCSLGWGKCTHGILKNHYPKGLRRQ